VTAAHRGRGAAPVLLNAVAFGAVALAAVAPTQAAPATATPATAPAVTATPEDPRALYLFRFELDEDLFLGSDDAFTAGWSLQLHSRLDDRWHPGYAKWIGRFPGLGDDGPGGRVARWAFGLGQAIITPTDIGSEAPQPDDVPWAGILTASVSWSAYDDRRLGALQLLVGCMGPCSGAESVQKFIHNNLHLGDPVRGWDHQLAEQWLGNANYEYRYKVDRSAASSAGAGRFARDLSVGGQVGLGNFATFGAVQVEYRFGWGLPGGFARTPDPAGLGVMLDPVYFDPAGAAPVAGPWRSYFTLVGRTAYIQHLAPAEGGETVDGGFQPGLDREPWGLQSLFGYHLESVPFAFHATWYHYFEQEKTGIKGSSDWINMSFEYRF
jgi:outer membrane protein LpxR